MTLAHTLGGTPTATSRSRRTSTSRARPSRATAAGRRDAARRRLPDRPRRAHARRERAAQRRDVRLDLDGAAGREAHGRVLRQEHDRQGRVPADRRDREALREHPRQPLARADADEATGCSTTGSSEAAMLGGLVSSGAGRSERPRGSLRQAEHRDGHQRPDLREKFANYWDSRRSSSPRRQMAQFLAPETRDRREHDRRRRDPRPTVVEQESDGGGAWARDQPVGRRSTIHSAKTSTS